MQPSKAWIISDTIEKNKRVFKIPVYQRNYDWTNIQCEKLYSDILDAYQTQQKHFTGTIVYIIGERNSSSLTEDLIIDGQQRITSILLLLKAMLDIAIQQNDLSMQSELSDLLFNRHCSEEFKLKLKPVKADDKQFQALMQNNSDCFDTNSHIIRNYLLFKKLIARSLEHGLLLSDILEGMKKLEIVEIVLDKSQGDEPQAIFESINSTGLELSLADKIRNFVLMDDLHQDDLFERYWLPLEERIGSADLADYFITFLDYKISDAVSKKNAYDKFRSFFIANHYTHEQFLQELEKYSRYYAAFIGKSTSYSPAVNKVLADFRALDQSTVYVFLFNIFSDYEKGIIDENILLQILLFLRSYSMRRIICEHASNTLRGLYKTLYSRLFKTQENYSHYYETIYTFFKLTNTKDKLVSDEEFFDALVYKKLYTKKKACKFLLSALENEGTSEQLLTDSLTIEHILPQKENAVVWKKEIGESYSYVYQNYLHTLGNLTITGHNSELGTKPFSEKKRIIAELSKAKFLNEMILNQSAWTADAIINRAKVLAQKALLLFQIQETDLLNTFDSSAESVAYTLADRNSIAGTIPVSFSFCGEFFAVKTYASMLSSMVSILYDLEPSVMESLALKKYQISANTRPYISTDTGDLRRCKEINNSGIFYEINLSASSILSFIKGLIEEYAFDPDEFEFFCQAT